MAATAAQLHIESAQTAVPTRVVAEPGRTRLVAVAAPPLPAAAVQRRFRTVLYYRGGGGGAAPWGEEGMWVKESLSEALADHPEFAGRLRRRADGSWEVKLNDTGVRLVQATAEASLDDFLGAKDRPRKEAGLAQWTDVNADDPDMCPPLYMQLTRFQGGDGEYAIGVSCALLLADPLSLARFLLSWARTHARVKERSKGAAHPMMLYASYLRCPDAGRRRVKSVALDSFASDAAAGGGGHADTLLFRARAADDLRALARACADRASDELGAARASRLSLVAAAPPGKDDGHGGTTSIETCTAPGPGAGAGGELEAAQWSELGLEELVLRDSKPVHVSCSIVTGGDEDEALVVVMPDGAGLLVTAIVPTPK